MDGGQKIIRPDMVFADRAVDETNRLTVLFRYHDRMALLIFERGLCDYTNLIRVERYVTKPAFFMCLLCKPHDSWKVRIGRG